MKARVQLSIFTMQNNCYFLGTILQDADNRESYSVKHAVWYIENEYYCR